VARYERKDHFHRRAKREGFRSRAAYKLAQIQRDERLLRPGQRVADLGCWPGGWLQVAARAVGPGGRVVGIDLAELEEPLAEANVRVLAGDLAHPDSARRLCEALGGRAQVVLCDAAPKLTGVRASDRAREEALLEAVEALLPGLLAPGGDLLLKLLEGPEAQMVEGRLRGRFRQAKRLKPEASRRGTTERYLLARGYAPPASPKQGESPAGAAG
jgi:23S rRNA (uridine2552-2'-O)-methyltransferase